MNKSKAQKPSKAASDAPWPVVKSGLPFEQWQQNQRVNFRLDCMESVQRADLEDRGVQVPELVEDDNGLHVVEPPPVISGKAEREILKALAEADEPMKFGDVVKASGWSKSVVGKWLPILVGRGVVLHHGQRGGYSVRNKSGI